MALEYFDVGALLPPLGTSQATERAVLAPAERRAERAVLAPAERRAERAVLAPAERRAERAVLAPAERRAARYAPAYFAPRPQRCRG